jgi:hypothetical protein
VVASQRLYHIKGELLDTTTGRWPEKASFEVSYKLATGFGSLGRGPQFYDAKNGTFQFAGLEPATYNITATFGATIPAVETVITLTDSDVEGVILRSPSETSLRGSIKLDSQVSNVLTADMSNARVQLEPILSSQRDVLFAAGADGQISPKAIPAGRYRVNVLHLPATAYVKTASLNGGDALHRVVEIAINTSNTLEIVLSPNGGTVQGSVVNDQRQAIPNARVVLVPSRRENYAYYRTTTTNQLGEFSLQGVAPGEFKVFALLQSLDGDSLRDPAILAPIESRGVSVTATQGSIVTTQIQQTLFPQ